MSQKDKIPGGLADKKKPSDFDSEALAAGIKVEMEHTSDKAIAEEIAMDHLQEDKDYYMKLKTIEKCFRSLGYFFKKGGPGSGQKGHHTDKPYPGVDAHNMPAIQPPTPGLKTLQLHELPISHYTTPNLDKYRKLLHLLGEKANGKFTYDIKTDSIMALDDSAKGMVQDAIKAKQNKTPKPKE